MSRWTAVSLVIMALLFGCAGPGTQDRVKAYCTCEGVLLDVRTGLIPFTTVITRDRSDQKEKEDLDLNETMRRAESAAVLDSLNALSDRLVAFLARVPATSE